MSAQQTRGSAPNPAAEAAARLQQEVQRSIERARKGVAYFTSAAPAVGCSPKTLLAEQATMRLYHYHTSESEVYRIPVLLVMAPTNRGYILDLAPGQSFVEFLIGRGYDVYMLEWEAPRHEHRNLDLASYALDFIGAALARVQQDCGEAELSLLGYCAGGLLSCLHAAAHQDHGIRNLVCFTTPVDFAELTLFRNWADQRYFDVDGLVAQFGNIPPEIIFAGFDALRPATRVAAQLRLWDNMWNDEFVRSFRMFDRWGVDALGLPGGYFRDMVKLLLWDNALVRGELTLRGQAVRLDRITVPFLHVVAEHDHIVTRGASAPLIAMVGSADKEEIMLKGGHVSIAAGGNAVRRMWPAVDRFLAERSL